MEGKDKLERGNYCPISVLNIGYKLFTSILSKRLESILHEDQTGFIRHRQTQENIGKVMHVLGRLDDDMLSLSQSIWTLSKPINILKVYGLPSGYKININKLKKWH